MTSRPTRRRFLELSGAVAGIAGGPAVAEPPSSPGPTA